jgi:hypothetical protein
LAFWWNNRPNTFESFMKNSNLWISFEVMRPLSRRFDFSRFLHSPISRYVINEK